MYNSVPKRRFFSPFLDRGGIEKVPESHKMGYFTFRIKFYKILALIFMLITAKLIIQNIPSESEKTFTAIIATNLVLKRRFFNLFLVVEVLRLPRDQKMGYFVSKIKFYKILAHFFIGLILN